MKTEYVKAIFDGEVVKTQVFNTERGIYQLFHVRNGRDIYFYKYKNGKMVECCNLSTLEGKQIG